MDKYSTSDILRGDRIVNVLKGLKDTGIFAYSLTGGEVSLKFETALKILSADHGLDIYKYNTNGSFFNTVTKTVKYLTALKKAGFSGKNKYIKPVFVVSIGQQNQAGLPLQNAVNVMSQFYKIFDVNKVVFSLNVTDKNLLLARKIYQDFTRLYKKNTGEKFNERLFKVRLFTLNNIDTLRRLRMPLGENTTIPELLKDYKNNYLSGGCFNIKAKNTGNDERAETLIPRIVLRPNGDVYTCQGYSYVHLAGNILRKPLESIIETVNRNDIYKTIFTKNLAGLYQLALKKNPKVKNLILKSAYDPCDLCKVLTASLTKG
jgi:MoaA/NifB/PqqE/SkfB family radical SAM enzyme